MPDSPWDAPSLSAAIEFQPLFDSAEVLSMSELDVAKGACRHYSAGRSLAILHSAGILHGDLYNDHIFYDARNGRTSFIDFGGASLVAISPTAMATDFVTPHASFPKDRFAALVAGYCKESLLKIEPTHPGYLDGILQHIGGKWENRLSSTPTPWIDSCLMQLGLELQTTQRKVTILPRSTQLALREEGDFEKALCLLCGLIVCGVECAELGQAVALSSNPMAWEGQFHRTLWDLCDRCQVRALEIMPTRNTEIAVRYLQLLQSEISYPEVVPNPGGRPTGE